VIGIGDIGAVIVKKLRDGVIAKNGQIRKGQTHSESSRRKLEQYLFQSKRSFKMSISFSCPSSKAFPVLPKRLLNKQRKKPS